MTTRHYSGSMACVRDALMDAGIDASHLPPGVTFEQAKEIAEQHGVRFQSGAGQISIGEEPVVAVYDNCNGRTSHAEYCASPAEIDASRPVVGMFSRLWGWK